MSALSDEKNSIIGYVTVTVDRIMLLETANIVENPPVSALAVYYNRYGLEAMALCPGPSRVKSRFIGLGWLCVLFVSQAALGVYCF